MATDKPADQHATWIASVTETALDPDLAICDPHHHLWLDTGHTGWPYPLVALHADTDPADGAQRHNVVRTVFLECHAEYRMDGPEHLRPVGEVEFVAALAEESAQSGKAEIAGIMGNADLSLDTALVDETLDAHDEAGRGRFRGVRYITAQDPHPPLAMGDSAAMDDPLYLANVARLGARGLTYDAMVYHPQLGEVVDVARACPDTSIVIDHLGGVLGTGPYKDRRDEILAFWRQRMAELASCPNTFLKLGGIGMPMMGFRWDKRATPATSDELAELWGEPIRAAIDLFGPERCMFESNFPVDKRGAGYTVLWNAFKKITADASAGEKRWLFHDSAATAYRLPMLADD